MTRPPLEKRRPRPPAPWAAARAIERREVRERDGELLDRLAEKAEQARRAAVAPGDGGAPF